MLILVHSLMRDRSCQLKVNVGSLKPQDVLGAGVQLTARETFFGKEHGGRAGAQAVNSGAQHISLAE